MKEAKKILWYEGMTLDPHHFQQWDRYHNNNLQFYFRYLNPNFWGLTQLSIDNESITNGSFKLIGCAGILRDGTTFNLPEDSDLPSSRDFNELFQPTQNQLGVYLGLPSEKIGGKNVNLDSATEDSITRYSLQNIAVADDSSGSDFRNIGVARLNFHILFSNEPLEEYTVIKLAEIIRTSENEFALNQDYIPTCLLIRASISLQKHLREILEFLVARSNALRNNRRFTSSGQLDVNLAEYSNYGRLLSISECIPFLNQCTDSGFVHPMEVYKLLTDLTSQLTVYSPAQEITPSSFPTYDHSNLTSLFLGIQKHIKQLLGEMVVEQYYQNIPLQKKSEHMYIAEIQREEIFTQSELFLTCKGDVPSETIISDLPDKIRIASSDMINEVLSTATRALSVQYSSETPRGIPAKEGVHYLHLEKKGPFWEAITRNHEIALFIPSGFTTIVLELLAVKR